MTKKIFIGILFSALMAFTLTTINQSLTASIYTPSKSAAKNIVLHADENNIEMREVQMITNGMIKTMFFEYQNTKYCYVKKVNTNYEISIFCDKSINLNFEAIEAYHQSRKNLQKLFPNNQIVFNLVNGTLDNVMRKIC